MNVPNAITLLGLGCGLLSIVQATDSPAAAASLLVCALVLDRLDGVAARLLGQTSDMGERLDSLADMVSFSVAPALLLYAMSGSAEVLACGVLYTLCGAWRLARYHEDGLVDSRFGRAFVGVPTPGAAAWLLLVAAYLPAPWRGPGFCLGLLLGGALMVSQVPYPRDGVVLIATVLSLVASLAGFWGMFAA